MNPERLTTVCILATFSASSFARTALADPESAARNEDRTGPEARSDDSAQPQTLDAKLLARVEQLQADQRASHREALKDPKAWAETRQQRATAHKTQLAALWGNLAGSIDGQARLRTHAERMARLNRILDLAEQKNDPALLTRVRAAIERELIRHVRAMQELRPAMGTR